MLGRQQIAGVPTAISELFKNAHDAYATRVAVDLVRRRNLLVIRDDGTGMSPADFENRWLTLGTDNKMPGGPTRSAAPPAGQSPRPVLGEKGIGRLAIAALGPQVVVVTRSAAAGHTLVALVNWTLFEAPGLNLDDLDIPTVVLEPDEACDQSVVDGLKAVLLAGTERLAGSDDAAVVRARQQVADLLVDPAGLQRALGEPTLGPTDDAHGTQFWVSPVSEAVTAALETPFHSGPERGTPPVEKLLLGFTDTMLPDRPPPVIKPSFRDWTSTGTPDDLIESEEFFTPADFEKADHHITGTFDEWGRFEGTVRVYRTKAEPHVVAWSGTSAVKTACGPFRFDLAIVQGNPDESLVDPLDWAPLTQKLNKLGGLYIYRDGIRILPYGSNDYDFINIEKRRTANAARWYFSYRRMMGVVSLDGNLNRALEEKAGREGFLENKAYRQFRDILANFFVQTVADFFRTDGTGGGSTAFKERQEELQVSAAAKKKRDKQKLERRRQFEGTVADRMSELQDGTATQAVDVLLELSAAELASIKAMSDPDAAATALIQAESGLRDRIRRVRATYQVSRPRGIGLSRRATADLDAYEQQVAEFFSTKLEPAARLVADEADELSSALGEAAGRKARLDAALREQADAAKSAVRAAGRTVDQDLDTAVAAVRDLITSTNREISILTTRVTDDAVRVDLTNLNPTSFEELRDKFAAPLEEAATHARQRFDVLRSRLQGVLAQVEDPDADVEAADQEEVLALRDREALDFELVQLGQAIAIIDHEYNAAIREVRSTLRDLKPWADRNPSLGTLYGRIRTSFDHLDGYLKMFTPLQRRLYRTAVPITGVEIQDYVHNLFGERLERHSIALEVSQAFRTLTLQGIPSVYFPVFVNLMDNAIYWTSTTRPPRSIRLDCRNSEVLIDDTGPGVIGTDVERIFELGFSRRNGRGMGLYIAQRALSEAGASLSVDPQGSPDGGARFVLSLPSMNEE